MQHLASVSVVIRLLACGALTLPAVADTVTVGPDVAIYDFDNIQAAVDAAQSGDVVRVAPGAYSSFIVDKSLTVLGPGADLATVTMVQKPFGGYESGVAVFGIDEGFARVGGFEILPAGKSGLDDESWVDVAQCKASVELFDIRIQVDQPYQTNFGRSGFFSVYLSRQVVLSGCDVIGAADLPTPIVPLAGDVNRTGFHGLHAEDSAVWAANCSFEGNGAGSCLDQPLELGPEAGAGVRARESNVTLSNCRMRGGQGSPSLAGCPSATAGAGLRVSFASVVEIHNGPDSSIVGGFGAGDSAPGAGALIGGPAALYYDASQLPEGGASETGAVGDSIEHLAGVVTVQPIAGLRPTLRPDDATVAPGGTLQLTYSGTPGSLHWTVFSRSAGSTSVGFPVIGEVFVDPVLAGQLQVVGVDAAGLALSVIHVPADPALIDYSALFQTAEIGFGPFPLSNPIVIAVVP